MKRYGIVAFVATISILHTSVAPAATFDFTADIDGAQANAGNGTGSPGVGLATVTYDDQSELLAWDISWSGLIGTETVMHFHGPAPAGENAGVQVDFGSISGTSSPSIGSTTITADQAADLLSELWYVNIHTTEVTGGEIRGQVLLVPEPALSTGLALACLALAAVVRRRSQH